jgi:hypothetical protein
MVAHLQHIHDELPTTVSSSSTASFEGVRCQSTWSDPVSALTPIEELDSAVFRRCTQCGHCVEHVTLASDLARAWEEKKCADFQTIEWRAQRLRKLLDELPEGGYASGFGHGIDWISKEEYDEQGAMFFRGRRRCF